MDKKHSITLKYLVYYFESTKFASSIFYILITKSLDCAEENISRPTDATLNE